MNKKQALQKRLVQLHKERDEIDVIINQIEEALYLMRLRDQITKFDLHNPELSQSIIYGLVRSNESFEDWHQRVFVNTVGYQEGVWDEHNSEEKFNQGGLKPEHKYVKKLVKAKDPRILETKVYKEMVE